MGLTKKTTEEEKKQEEKYFCTCGRFYRTIANYMRHKKFQCGKEKKFQCKNCSRKFLYVSYLETHLKYNTECRLKYS